MSTTTLTIADRINAAASKMIVPVPHQYGRSDAIRAAKMAKDGKQVLVQRGRSKGWVWLATTQVRTLDAALARIGL